MLLPDILFSQGFGSRRQCLVLVESGAVRINGMIVEDVTAEFVVDNLIFDVRLPLPSGAFSAWQRWVYCEQTYVIFHKPSGYEVSQKPTAWPSVYSLLPLPLRQRNKGALQAVGRLDQDTTGLLLFSDDGGFIHRMTSPKKEVEKIYRVSLKHAATEKQVQQLLEGVVLREEGRPQVSVKASSCNKLDDYTLVLGLTQGKYHQVKRMVAAVGNRVEALHRTQIGDLVIPETLMPGQWSFLSATDLAKI